MQVFIRNLELMAHIGVHGHEHHREQPVRINVDITVEGVDVTADKLDKVVDYEALTQRIRGLIAEGHVKLAETLADRIANFALPIRACAARVRVEKLHALPGADPAAWNERAASESRGTNAMNRRQMLLTGAGMIAVAAATRGARGRASDTDVPNPPPETAHVSAEAHALYERALVFDANAGPAGSDAFPFPEDVLDVSRTSGITAVKTSLGGINSNFQDTVAEIAFFQRVIEAHPDVFMQIRVASDIARAKQDKKLGILLSFESADMFDGKVERVELFRNLGVRVMQLSYNKTSPFASGVMQDPPTGLTELGRKAVDAMNTNGVAIDISHASLPSYMDTLAASKKPVLVTHTGCAAVHKHPRNKTDAQLRAAAEKGGVIGIFDLPYLTASPKQPTLDDYMAHMTHALKICGEDHVGVGSDSSIGPWDLSPEGAEAFRKMEEERHKAGLAAPEEDRPMYVIGMNHNRRIETIADALLKRGYSGARGGKGDRQEFHRRADGDLGTSKRPRAAAARGGKLPPSPSCRRLPGSRS